jgi:uncharacterized protein (TIGR02147 family)
MKPNIFNYLDYRQYLFDIIAYLSRESPTFSFSEVARHIGSKSPEFLRDIKARKLNITRAAGEALASYFDLGEQEREYFQSIIAFDHAKKLKDKDRALQKMLQLREYPVIKTLDQDQYDYFAHWYMPIVRELATSLAYNDDPQWIAERIVPRITVVEAEKALDLLVSLKLIFRNEKSGKWELTDTVISSSAEVRTRAAANYHTEAINLARESIGRFKSTERDIRGLTMRMPPEGFKEIKKRLEAFWKELLAYSETQTPTKADLVYQINMQMFPVSTSSKEKSE